MQFSPVSRYFISYRLKCSQNFILITSVHVFNQILKPDNEVINGSIHKILFSKVVFPEKVYVTPKGFSVDHFTTITEVPGEIFWQFQ
jgi:hypothetical protein